MRNALAPRPTISAVLGLAAHRPPGAPLARPTGERPAARWPDAAAPGCLAAQGGEALRRAATSTRGAGRYPTPRRKPPPPAHRATAMSELENISFVIPGELAGMASPTRPRRSRSSRSSASAAWCSLSRGRRRPRRWARSSTCIARSPTSRASRAWTSSAPWRSSTGRRGRSPFTGRAASGAPASCWRAASCRWAGRRPRPSPRCGACGQAPSTTPSSRRRSRSSSCSTGARTSR